MRLTTSEKKIVRSLAKYGLGLAKKNNKLENQKKLVKALESIIAKVEKDLAEEASSKDSGEQVSKPEEAKKASVAKKKTQVK